MKILTVIGARPQIIKAAALSRTINHSFKNEIEEIILHTGQHYDNNMSEVFIEELGIPKPNYNLNVGSGSHAVQTAQMMEGIEVVLLSEEPDAIVLYGDTNSTLAGAIAASKLHVPVVHIEAGLRSFNKNMPEEINRIMCDHAATLMFSPTITGVENLQSEGFTISSKGPYTADNPGVYHCGDVMYDNSLYFADLANEKVDIKDKFDVEKEEFLLVTIHRPANTDDTEKLSSIFEAFIELSENKTIVLPLHPRTKAKFNLLDESLVNKVKKANINIIEPVSFLEMIALERSASMVLTDSGGVQKEAYYFQKPCIILREETEWVELVANGNAILVGSDKNKILDAYNTLSDQTLDFPPVFGDGKAAEFICKEMLKHLG